MKYAIDSQHRDFFQKHKTIELEDLLSPVQVKDCQIAIDQELSSRLKVSQETLKKCSPEQLFMSGHDFWRSDAYLKKIVCQKGFAEIASDLVGIKPILLGYDQWIVPPSLHPLKDKEFAPYLEMMQKTATLQEISAYQGLVCGLILCLSDFQEKEKLEPSLEENEVSEKKEMFFPKKAGNGVFFHPEALIPFETLVERQGQQFLLIAYAERGAVYTMQKGDPHLHAPKRFGYQFGDKLTMKYHPTLFS